MLKMASRSFGVGFIAGEVFVHRHAQLVELAHETPGLSLLVLFHDPHARQYSEECDAQDEHHCDECVHTVGTSKMTLSRGIAITDVPPMPCWWSCSSYPAIFRASSRDSPRLTPKASPGATGSVFISSRMASASRKTCFVGFFMILIVYGCELSCGLSPSVMALGSGCEFLDVQFELPACWNRLLCSTSSPRQVRSRGVGQTT